MAASHHRAGHWGGNGLVRDDVHLPPTPERRNTRARSTAVLPAPTMADALRPRRGADRYPLLEQVEADVHVARVDPSTLHSRLFWLPGATTPL